MLFTEPMKSVELLVLKTDADRVIRHLGFAGCLQIVSEPREARDLPVEEREAADLRLKIQSLAKFLGVEGQPVPPLASTAPDRFADARQASDLMTLARPLIDEETALVQRRVGLRQAADEIGSFSRVNVALSEVQNLSYLAVRLGSVAPERLAEVTEALSPRAVVVPLDRPGYFMAISPKKGRWALDSELSRFEFQPAQFPADRTGVPAEIAAAIREELAQVDLALQDLERRKAALRNAHGAELAGLLFELELHAAVDAVRQTLASTGSVQKVTGWIPRRRLAGVLEDLDSLTQGRIAVRVFDPSEMPEVKSGKVKVPVSTPHGRLTRSFERMVFSYGVPLYGSIDPTPFVAVMFVILFAIMFGDVGQGFVGVILGLLINSGRVASFEQYRRKSFGTAFLIVGIASMISGFLYGSFFANEHVLEPATKAVTLALLGRPIAHIISLEGFQKIILFFGITIGFGAVINSIGLVINIVNLARRGDWERAILSKTGAAGALFFWYVLSLGARMVAGGPRIGPMDFALIALPLLALFFREPIVHLVKGRRPLFKEGVFSFVIEGIIEVLESAIYYVSNSVSFLRVAAFALAHTVLSTIVFLLSDMVGGSPGGLAFRILVILVGNSIIVVLEGLIVTIQVVRLQYYEFFSKFFNETGEEFTPFILRSSGGVR
jgi:V/A-type H+/Na+-transporting ATPase subunit I